MMRRTRNGRWLRQNGAIIVFLDAASMVRTELVSKRKWEAPLAEQESAQTHRETEEYEDELLDDALELDEFLYDPELEEEEFRVANLPFKVRDAFSKGPLAWPLAVHRAIEAGRSNLEDLTDMVFFMHHPERILSGTGRALDAQEPQFEKLRKEWKAWRTLVRPLVEKSGKPKASTTRPRAIVPFGKLKWGVPGGIITDPFYRSRDDAQRVFGIRGRAAGKHLGIDVSGARSAIASGALNDARRGLPVYATIKSEISIADLNKVRVMRDKTTPREGLGIKGRGIARLQDALVLIQPWKTKKPENVINEWGGILGLACRYWYEKLDGSRGEFTLYIEYLHLITEDYPPIDKRGNKFLSTDAWVAMGKKAGFGSEMQNRRVLSASQMTGSKPLLVGYLGATAGPHVHINANYAEGNQRRYLYFPRFDPAIMIS